MGKIGIGEIILILAVLVLLFGAKKIPEIAQSIGQAIKEFKKASKDENDAKTLAQDDSAKTK